MTDTVTQADEKRAKDWAFMLGRMGGVVLDSSQVRGLAAQFAAHRAASNGEGVEAERKTVLQNKRVNDAIQTALERGELTVSSDGYLASLNPSQDGKASS
jgi:hypothetical protein